MSILAKLSTNEDNEEVLSEGLAPESYEAIVKSLTIPDIQLILNALDTLYFLSGLGETTATGIVTVYGSIDILVCLVTVQAESYGNRAIAGFKIVENKSSVYAQKRSSSHAVHKQPNPARNIHPGGPHVAGMPHQPQIPGSPKRPSRTPTPPSRPTFPAGIPPPIPLPIPSRPEAGGTLSHEDCEEVNPEIFAANWISAFYELDANSSVSRSDMYSDYLMSCSKLGRLGILSAANFNKVLRMVIPGQYWQGPQTNIDGHVTITGIKKRAVPLSVQNRVPKRQLQPPNPTQGIPLRALPIPPQGNIPRELAPNQVAGNARQIRSPPVNMPMSLPLKMPTSPPAVPPGFPPNSVMQHIPPPNVQRPASVEPICSPIPSGFPLKGPPERLPMPSSSSRIPFAGGAPQGTDPSALQFPPGVPGATGQPVLPHPAKDDHLLNRPQQMSPPPLRSPPPYVASDRSQLIVSPPPPAELKPQTNKPESLAPGKNQALISQCQNVMEQIKREMQQHFMQFHIHRQQIQSIQTQLQQVVQQNQAQRLPQNLMGEIQSRVQNHHNQMQMHYQKLQQLQTLLQQVQQRLLMEQQQQQANKGTGGKADVTAEQNQLPAASEPLPTANSEQVNTHATAIPNNIDIGKVMPNQKDSLVVQPLQQQTTSLESITSSKGEPLSQSLMLSGLLQHQTGITQPQVTQHQTQPSSQQSARQQQSSQPVQQPLHFSVLRPPPSTSQGTFSQQQPQQQQQLSQFPRSLQQQQLHLMTVPRPQQANQQLSEQQVQLVSNPQHPNSLPTCSFQQPPVTSPVMFQNSVFPPRPNIPAAQTFTQQATLSEHMQLMPQNQTQTLVDHPRSQLQPFQGQPQPLQGQPQPIQGQPQPHQRQPQPHQGQMQLRPGQPQLVLVPQQFQVPFPGQHPQSPAMTQQQRAPVILGPTQAIPIMQQQKQNEAFQQANQQPNATIGAPVIIQTPQGPQTVINGSPPFRFPVFQSNQVPVFILPTRAGVDAQQMIRPVLRGRPPTPTMPQSTAAKSVGSEHSEASALMTKPLPNSTITEPMKHQVLMSCEMPVEHKAIKLPNGLTSSTFTHPINSDESNGVLTKSDNTCTQSDVASSEPNPSSEIVKNSVVEKAVNLNGIHRTSVGTSLKNDGNKNCKIDSTTENVTATKEDQSNIITTANSGSGNCNTVTNNMTATAPAKIVVSKDSTDALSQETQLTDSLDSKINGHTNDNKLTSHFNDNKRPLEDIAKLSTENVSKRIKISETDSVPSKEKMDWIAKNGVIEGLMTKQGLISELALSAEVSENDLIFNGLYHDKLNSIEKLSNHIDSRDTNKTKKSVIAEYSGEKLKSDSTGNSKTVNPAESQDSTVTTKSTAATVSNETVAQPLNRSELKPLSIITTTSSVSVDSMHSSSVAGELLSPVLPVKNIVRDEVSHSEHTTKSSVTAVLSPVRTTSPKSPTSPVSIKSPTLPSPTSPLSPSSNKSSVVASSVTPSSPRLPPGSNPEDGAFAVPDLNRIHRAISPPRRKHKDRKHRMSKDARLEKETVAKCQWQGCKSVCDSSRNLLSHMVCEHAPPEGTMGSCRVPGCNTVQRPRGSMICHFQQKHCDLRSMGLDDPKVTLPELLFPKVADSDNEDESPVTRSVRLTAALILRNIAKNSSLGRQMLRTHESKIAVAAMSLSEASSALAQCLSELSRTRKLSNVDSIDLEEDS